MDRLLYLTIIRSDITFSIQQLSQFMVQPYTSHWKVVIKILKHLKGSIDLRLKFGNSWDLELTAYCDADWGSCTDTRKSSTGYCIFLGDCLVLSKSQSQNPPLK